MITNVYNIIYTITGVILKNHQKHINVPPTRPRDCFPLQLCDRYILIRPFIKHINIINE